MGVKTWMARQERGRARRVDYRGGGEATAAPEPNVAQGRESVDGLALNHDAKGGGNTRATEGIGNKKWQATEKIQYNREIRLGTLNCQGLAALRRENK